MVSIARRLAIASLLLFVAAMAEITAEGWSPFSLAASVASANTGCAPDLTSDPVTWYGSGYDCSTQNYHYRWINMPYEDLDEELICSGVNPSYYVLVEWTTCSSNTPPSGTLRAYEEANGPLVATYSFAAGTTSLRSQCFDSCNWPEHWVLELQYSSGEFIRTIDWSIGCCDCETYENPCI